MLEFLKNIGFFAVMVVILFIVLTVIFTVVFGSVLLAASIVGIGGC